MSKRIQTVLARDNIHTANVYMRKHRCKSLAKCRSGVCKSVGIFARVGYVFASYLCHMCACTCSKRLVVRTTYTCLFLLSVLIIVLLPIQQHAVHCSALTYSVFRNRIFRLIHTPAISDLITCFQVLI